MTTDSLVTIGRVNRTHGVKGELRVSPFTDSPDLFSRYNRLYFRLTGGERGLDELVQIIEARPHKNIVLLKLKGVFTREAAARFVGAEVLIPRAWLPPTEAGEYYWTDLIGLKVIDERGLGLGRIERIFQNGDHDILVLKEGDREILLPFLNDVVISVDCGAGIITASPPDGLLDL